MAHSTNEQRSEQGVEVTGSLISRVNENPAIHDRNLNDIPPKAVDFDGMICAHNVAELS